MIVLPKSITFLSFNPVINTIYVQLFGVNFFVSPYKVKCFRSFVGQQLALSNNASKAKVRSFFLNIPIMKMDY